VIEAVFVYIITTLLDPIKGFILNNFTSQNFPINDFIAGVGIFAIVGFTAIAVLLILQLRNYLVNRSLDIVITEKNPNQKLDELIQEIEDFTNRWQFGTGMLSSYRRQIEMNSIVLDHKELSRINNYDSDIYPKIKSVRDIGVPNINNTLDSLEQTIDKLIQFGSEMKRVYWSGKQLKVIMASQPQIKDKLISDGDKISDEFNATLVQLRMLRKHLP
jgi:hypothetical protein